MENGYKIFWTNHALEELSSVYDYLEENFTDKEKRKLSTELNNLLTLISKFPETFPRSETLDVRRVVVIKYNTLYYREKNKTIEIISFFSNRKNPNKLKL